MTERRNIHDDPPPHTGCHAPAQCDCECRTCKRVWEGLGRPGPTRDESRNETLVGEAASARNIEVGQRLKLEEHHAELRLDAARQSLALALARIKELEGGIVAENKRTSEIEQELATLRGEEVVELEAVRNLLIGRDEDFHPDGAATVAEVVERILGERDRAQGELDNIRSMLAETSDDPPNECQNLKKPGETGAAVSALLSHNTNTQRDLTEARGLARINETACERALSALETSVATVSALAAKITLTRDELVKLRAAASSFLWEYRKWVPMSSRSSSRMTSAEQKLDELILVTDGSRSVACETCGGDLRYVGSQRGCRCPFTSSVPEPVAPNCIRCMGTGKVGPKNEYPCPDCLTRYNPSKPLDLISRSELVAACRRAAGSGDARSAFGEMIRFLEKP